MFALGIGEAYLTVQYDNVNFGTGVNTIIAIDTNDRLEQASGAKANIMAVGQTIQHANTTYQTVLRVWQDDLQRKQEISIGQQALQLQNILQMQVKALLWNRCS